MGYETPNIDRLAKEGMMFTDYYAEQSCTAGRSSFITGQSVFRTGLSKVGIPGADQGLSAEDPTIATLLKEQGYATAQFGKNHFGDLNKFVPTVHGFDEFYGVFYHLDAYEDPEAPGLPAGRQVPRLLRHLRAPQPGPRLCDRRGRRDGAAAVGQDRQAEARGQGQAGHRPDQDVRPGDRRRDEGLHGTVGRGRHAVLHLAELHAHARLHPDRRRDPRAVRAVAVRVPRRDDRIRPAGRRDPRQARRAGCGRQHDRRVLDRQRPHRNTMPDAGTTWFRSEKDTNWEGAFRVPCLLRWPGMVEPNSVSNEIVGSHDWLPTLVRAAGEPDVMDKLKSGYEANGKTYKVHIDGYDMTPYLTGETEEHSRPGFIYFSDDGDVLAMRYNNWKVVFMEQEVKGTLYLWMYPFTTLRCPKIFNLRTDPFEYADITSEHVLRLHAQARVRVRAGPEVGRRVPADLRGVPTPPEGRQLQPQQRAGQAAVGRRLEVMRTVQRRGDGAHRLTAAPPRFHVMAKPTGAVCNLACTYCFFLDKELLYPGSPFRMSDESARGLHPPADRGASHAAGDGRVAGRRADPDGPRLLPQGD